MGLTREERVANLAAANELRNARKRTAATDALAALVRSKMHVSVSAVAKRADVSRTFLYAQEDILAAIQEASAGQPHRLHQPRPASSTEASLQARLVATMDALGEVKAENVELRALVERLTAELAKKSAMQ